MNNAEAPSLVQELASQKRGAKCRCEQLPWRPRPDAARIPQGAARALSRTGLGGAPPTSPGGRAAELLGNLADSGPKGQTLCGAKKSQADVASAARAGDEPAFRSATCAEEVRNMLLQDACLLSETAGHLGVRWRDAWPRAARGDAGAAISATLL